MKMKAKGLETYFLFFLFLFYFYPESSPKSKLIVENLPLSTSLAALANCQNNFIEFIDVTLGRPGICFYEHILT